MNAMRVLMALLGGLGALRGVFYVSEAGWWPAGKMLGVAIAAILLGAAVGALLAKPVAVGLRDAVAALIAKLHHTPTYDIAAGSVGLISGLIIGILATLPLPRSIPVVGGILPAAVTLIIGYIGAMVAVRKRDDIIHMISAGSRVAIVRPSWPAGAATNRACPKFWTLRSSSMDASPMWWIPVFWKGRSSCPVSSGRAAAYSRFGRCVEADRGRRGLDILNRIQKEARVPVHIVDRDMNEAADVDGKLVRLAKALDGRVVTNDFNLNKVAEFQGVSVLNINELVNAVKPWCCPARRWRYGWSRMARSRAGRGLPGRRHDDCGGWRSSLHRRSGRSAGHQCFADQRRPEIFAKPRQAGRLPPRSMRTGGVSQCPAVCGQAG